MGGFPYVLPWFTPAPIGIIVCELVNPLSIGLFAALMGIDFLIYLPFFLKFDKEYVEKEDISSEDEKSQLSEEVKEILKDKHILLLCAGGGTSGIIANRMQEQAHKEGIALVVDSGAYGAQTNTYANYDLIVLAPQVLSYLPTLKKEVTETHIACVGLDASQYMSILENPNEGLETCSESIKEHL